MTLENDNGPLVEGAVGIHLGRDLLRHYVADRESRAITRPT